MWELCMSKSSVRCCLPHKYTHLCKFGVEPWDRQTAAAAGMQAGSAGAGVLAGKSAVGGLAGQVALAAAWLAVGQPGSCQTLAESAAAAAVAADTLQVEAVVFSQASVS